MNLRVISLTLCLLCFPSVLSHASRPPSLELFTDDDGYVYHEDPCVRALRGAMAMMEPYIPSRWKKKEDGYWYAMQQLTDQDVAERLAAGRVWDETKMQCWR